MYGFPPVGYFACLTTGDFLDGIFANWRAAVLQLFCLIVFGRKPREKGAAHSLKPNNEQRDKRNKEQDGHDRPWIYRNSLSVAFAVLFGLGFVGHLYLGAMNYNGRLHLIGKTPISIELQHEFHLLVHQLSDLGGRIRGHWHLSCPERFPSRAGLSRVETGRQQQ